MSCNCTQTANAAVITPVLAAGSVASPYYFQLNITQRLCQKSCASRTPFFQPTFSVVSWTAVGTDQYVAAVHVEGLIAYVPCGCDECATAAQLVSQNFTLPFYSATAPTAVTVAAGAPVNVIVPPACRTCGRTFVSETPITLTIA